MVPILEPIIIINPLSNDIYLLEINDKVIAWQPRSKPYKTK